METLNSIECFVRTCEAGSFSEAARRLGLTPAAVSKNVAKLEKRVGVRLFQRSTRSLTLTEAGQRFLLEVGEGLNTIQSAVANLASADGQPSGTLRVSMGNAFGLTYILPLLATFLDQYPRITPDWHFDNRPVDLIGENFDAAIGGGVDIAPGVVARNLGPAHRILVASPDYLKRHRPIKTPSDLASHHGILVRSPQTGRIRNWALTNREGAQAAIGLQPHISMSDPEAVCRVAQMGLGIALTGMPLALPHLENGSLVRVLPDWYVDTGMLAIYYPAQKLLPAKTRAFVEFIVEQFRLKDVARRFSARSS